ELPVVLGAAHAGAWVALDGVVQVGEFERVAEKEHGGVIADQVPVAFFGVELHGDTADVALGVSRAALARNGREANEHGSFFADFGKDLGLGVFGDVFGDGQRAVSACALG